MGKRNKCKTKYCKNKKAHGRSICNKCKTRNWRLKNPDLAAFHRKKHNAKRRGITFELTFEDFMLVYVKGYVLDRDDATRGYELGNVLPISIHANAVKSAVDRARHQSTMPLDDVPF